MSSNLSSKKAWEPCNNNNNDKFIQRAKSVLQIERFTEVTVPPSSQHTEYALNINIERLKLTNLQKKVIKTV